MLTTQLAPKKKRVAPSPTGSQVRLDFELVNTEGVELLTRTYRALFFRTDHVLVTPFQGMNEREQFRANPDDWRFLPGMRETLILLSQAQVSLALIDNVSYVGLLADPEVARKEEQAVRRAQKTIARTIGPWVHTYVCFTSAIAGKTRPDYYQEDDPDRLPNTGMLEQAVRLASEPPVAPTQACFVGRHIVDEQAAATFGCRYMEAQAFWECVLLRPSSEAQKQHEEE